MIPNLCFLWLSSRVGSTTKRGVGTLKVEFASELHSASRALSDRHFKHGTPGCSHFVLYGRETYKQTKQNQSKFSRSDFQRWKRMNKKDGSTSRNAVSWSAREHCRDR